MDIRDLTAALKDGDTIEEAAEHPCRSGSVMKSGAKLKRLG